MIPVAIYMKIMVVSWCCTYQLLNTYFEIYLGIAVGKNRKENMEGL